MIKPAPLQNIAGNIILFLMSKLQEAMKAAGLTQEGLARKACVTVATVRNVLKGKHPPRESTRKLIADALGMPEDVLFSSGNIIAGNVEAV